MRTRGDIYPYANTVICIEDSKLLKQFQYDILHSTANLQAALDELSKIDYFQTHEDADNENYGALLDKLTRDTLKKMRSIVPTELIWRIFALYYDIHNMKLVVKERFSGQKLDRLAMPQGSLSLPTIRSATVRESDNILGSETLSEGLFEALRAGGMYDIDFILDRTYFRALRGLAEEMGSERITEFVIERIDLFNISAYCQSQAAGVPEWYFSKAFSGQGSRTLSQWQEYIEAGPGGMERSPLWLRYKPIWEAAASKKKVFEELDVLNDNYLIEKTKICKLMAFGIEPICAYYFNKFMEIKNIRILLVGKKNNYSTHEIRRRMRIPYEL